MRDVLISALTAAAEIEHRITCLYLFSAFSLKTDPSEGGVDWPQLERVRRWKAELLAIAREEMGHHGLVSNLLVLVGGPPNFEHTSFPAVSHLTPPFDSLDLLPFSSQALERFARYEALHTPQQDEGTSLPATIGDLYQKIGWSLAELDRRHPRLFIGPTDHQIDNRSLGLQPGKFDIDLVKASDLRSAQEVIARIIDHDHEERIEAIQREYAELKGKDPHFEPARPVAVNPQTRRGDGVEIRHAVTRRAAKLFNTGYEVMTQLLTRLYGRSTESTTEIQGLIQTAFFPLMTMVIRPLGEMLTLMPVDEEADSLRAGPCFEFPLGRPLHPLNTSAWISVHERLLGMVKQCGLLCRELEQDSEPWSDAVLPRCRFLLENLNRIASNFEHRMDLRKEYARHS